MNYPPMVRIGQAFLDRRGRGVLITHQDETGRFRGLMLGSFKPSKRSWDYNGRTGRARGTQDLVSYLDTALVNGRLMVGFPSNPIPKGA